MEMLIGRVVKSHGIRGEVAVELLTEESEDHIVAGAVLTGRQAGKEQRLTVKTVRPHQKRLLVSFEEIPDRTAADSLRGMKFYAEPLERDAEEDGYYDHELIGLEVRMDKARIGEVTGVMDTPNRKILEVDYQGREVLIPFVMDIVPEVDLEQGYLTITPPEGLLDV
ncbi:ribosome maturation factor RimM [Corynebacterium godavarianum]|uniref:Ribosome maturation factor RimM n=1 Tax=Corynebacterium godavarianum TaxID=2054421 RepID=A0ABY3E8L9_9CORY|nr:ribosome maturation factor RimM [Corynebacterium godavarianum]MBL7286195.1 ribosome maturation factor RimM [Corynebacterium godavarianum]TSJ76333.1 ribosome maturation factor RimM [Corynebacterium godavarianum]